MNKFILILSLLFSTSAYSKEDESLKSKVDACVNDRIDRVCGEFGSVQCMNTLQDICLDMAKNPSSFVAQSKLDLLQKQYGKKKPPIGLPTKIGAPASRALIDNAR